MKYKQLDAAQEHITREKLKYLYYNDPLRHDWVLHVASHSPVTALGAMELYDISVAAGISKECVVQMLHDAEGDQNKVYDLIACGAT